MDPLYRPMKIWRDFSQDTKKGIKSLAALTAASVIGAGSIFTANQAYANNNNNNNNTDSIEQVAYQEPASKTEDISAESNPNQNNSSIEDIVNEVPAEAVSPNAFNDLQPAEPINTTQDTQAKAPISQDVQKEGLAINSNASKSLTNQSNPGVYKPSPSEINQLNALITKYKSADEFDEFEKTSSFFGRYKDPLTQDVVSKKDAEKIALARKMVIGEAELYQDFNKMSLLGDLSNWEKTADGSYVIPENIDRLHTINNSDNNLAVGTLESKTFSEAEAIAFAKVFRDGADKFHSTNSRSKGYNGENFGELLKLVYAQERSGFEMLTGAGKYAGKLSPEEQKIAEDNAIYAISDIEKDNIGYNAGLRVYQGGDWDKTTAKWGTNRLTQKVREMDESQDGKIGDLITSPLEGTVEFLTFFPNRVVVNTDRLFNGKKNLTEVANDNYGFDPETKINDPIIECIKVDIDDKTVGYRTEDLPAQRMNDGRAAYGAVLVRDALIAYGMYNTFANGGSSSGGSNSTPTPNPTPNPGWNPNGGVVY